jgi:hypothetical protein
LAENGYEPAHLCSDAVFIRRIYLDVIGTLPKPHETRAFLRDKKPDKRATLIDDLLERDEFADYWTLKWCDVLRVKSEFPINLWPNAVQAYHRWIHDAIRTNIPYDQFARELLTSSGSNFRVPPVNFYRAVQGKEPDTLAHAAALTFMGTRIDTWPEDQRETFAAFFTRIGFKGTGEWKEEIVYFDQSQTEPLDATFPDGVAIQIAPDKDPRDLFAAWLTTRNNPWFAKAAVNRVWAWLIGRGIVHEPDDIREDNPPVNPALLIYLEREFVRTKYDLKHIYRLVLNSQTYQRSSIPQSEDPKAEALFAHYPVRRLEAEVLIDAINAVLGAQDSYESPIPEPFTYIPEHEPAIALADGSISSSFLEMFGRPSRDTGLVSERNNHPTKEQRLHLLNSTDIQRRIDRGFRVQNQIRMAKGDHRKAIQNVYITILCRWPTDEEIAAIESYAQRTGLSTDKVANDLIWALLNTKEFLYRH